MVAEDIQISEALSESDEQGEGDFTQKLEGPLTAVLFFVAAVTIFFATRWLWPVPLGTGTRQIVISIFNGMMLSLPILIALWTVLGTQMTLIRIPLATTALVALLAAYCGTLFTIPNGLSTYPTEMFLLFGGITLAITIAAHIPLWCLRVFNGVVISRKKTDSARAQFSIKHLLVTTTIFALLIPMIQWLGSIGNNGLPRSDLFDQRTLGFCGIFLLVLALLTLLSLVVVFLPKLRTWGLILLVLAILILPFAVSPSIEYAIGQRYTWDQLVDTGLNVAAFSLANALTIILVLSLYYRLGFRLQRDSA